MTKFSAWIQAFRLKTLPLAFSCILLGSLLAGSQMKTGVLMLTLLTTLFLQILSNLANDYGDYKSGVDNEQRLGPSRSIQQGLINPKEMLLGIIIFTLLSLLTGISLLLLVFKTLNIYFFVFFVLGIFAIVAAIKYTMGKNPYGYHGFGDLFVFLFFGWLGVLGTYYLHTQNLHFEILLPASSIGLLSTGVLNLNNLRDVENDRAYGKQTLVVKMGFQTAKIYHLCLMLGAVLTALTYVYIQPQKLTYHYSFLLISIIWIRQIIRVYNCQEPQTLNPELKILALSTLLFSVAYGIPFYLFS